MKVVIQKVNQASVTINNKEISKIGEGLLVFVAFTENDNIETIKYMVNKIINLRVFEDENKVMNLSVKNLNKEILSVSQFTLYGDCSKGNRPSYIHAMKNIEANKLYDLFNERLKEKIKVETGVFGADMKVNIINDGPVTILLESRD